MELLIDRNLTTYAYDDEKASEVEKHIHQKYFPLLSHLHVTLKKLSNE